MDKESITSKGKELAEKHWDSYIEPLLTFHNVDEETLKIAKFHYVTSGSHFYKHGFDYAMTEQWLE